jgi:hypothetical protein
VSVRFTSTVTSQSRFSSEPSDMVIVLSPFACPNDPMTYGTSCVCGPPVGGSHARSSESPYFSCARGAVKSLDRASCSSANPRLLCSFPNPLPIFSAQSAASYHQHITCLLVGTTGGLEKGRPSSGSVGLKEIVFGEKRRRPVGDWRRPRIDEIKSPTGGGRNGTGWPWPGQERGGGASSLFSLEILHGRHSMCQPSSSRPVPTTSSQAV